MVGGVNHVVIPLEPNTAYRLNLRGEKRLKLELFSTKQDGYNSKGQVSGYTLLDSTVFAAKIISYDGIFKTNAIQKNLNIEWMLIASESNQVGTNQNVAVKLERYNGNSSDFPDTIALRLQDIYS